MEQTINTLDAISPLDGRYASKTSRLRAFTSEHALIYYRVLVEVNWFKFLAAKEGIPELPALNAQGNEVLDELIDSFSKKDSEEIKKLEATTNHDVKAVEYFLKEAAARKQAAAAADVSDGGAQSASLESKLEFFHFACTSEDINNLAYARMLLLSRDAVMVPQMQKLEEVDMQHEHAHEHVGHAT